MIRMQIIITVLYCIVYPIVYIDKLIHMVSLKVLMWCLGSVFYIIIIGLFQLKFFLGF